MINDSFRMVMCSLCNGNKVVTDEITARWEKGRQLAEVRHHSWKLFREWAAIFGVSVKTISDWEVGREECPYTVDEYHQKAKGAEPDVVKSGYGGVMPNGNIVDRREHPEAVPIMGNPWLGIPEPEIGG